MNLRLFMAYPEQKARFENIFISFFMAILFYAGNLKIFVRNLGTISGAKLCHVRFHG